MLAFLPTALYISVFVLGPFSSRWTVLVQVEDDGDGVGVAEGPYRAVAVHAQSFLEPRIRKAAMRAATTAPAPADAPHRRGRRPSRIRTVGGR